MEKVFITRSTLYGIAFKTADIFRDQEDILNIYSNRLLKPFSHQEIKTISAVMSVLKSTDDEEIRLKIIEKYNTTFIKRRTDTLTPWVYVNNTPSFHMNQHCEKIVANYENYSIPVQIKQENYPEYRDFFIKNKDLFHSDYQKYLSRVELKFNVRIEYIKEIYAQNSGIQELSINKTTPKTPEQSLAAIDELAYKMDEFKNSSIEIGKIIENTGYNTKKAILAPQYSHCLDTINKWGSYKKELRNLIIDHMISLIAPENRFDVDFLISIGFKKCSICS